MVIMQEEILYNLLGAEDEVETGKGQSHRKRKAKLQSIGDAELGQHVIASDSTEQQY
jgi:hypothetical protein